MEKSPTIKGCCANAGYRKTFENIVLSLGKTVKISPQLFYQSRTGGETAGKRRSRKQSSPTGAR
ncbi:MAG: hypothetical protein LBT05_13735 [Planctomycetaceae bacterium]|nr:hypothetical protein [Planctomycetaceae bacterium]